MILDIKNANKLQKFIFQNSLKDRMTYDNISAAVKRRRDYKMIFYANIYINRKRIFNLIGQCKKVHFA